MPPFGTDTLRSRSCHRSIAVSDAVRIKAAAIFNQSRRTDIRAVPDLKSGGLRYSGIAQERVNLPLPDP